MADNRLCPACKGTGTHPQLARETILNFVTGTNPEVLKYTCPYCGYAEGVIDSHGDTITSADVASYTLMIGTVAKVDVGRCNTSPEQIAAQPPRP